MLPDFKAEAEERERRKMEELAPYIEQAMARKQRMAELRDDEIPSIVALGRQIAETDEGREALERLRKAGSVVERDPNA